MAVLEFRMQRQSGPGHAKMCLMAYANNKGADQPAHPRSLISTFDVRCLDSIIPILAKSKGGVLPCPASKELRLGT